MNRLKAGLLLSLFLAGCSGKNEYKSLAELVPSPTQRPLNLQPETKMETPRYFYPFSSKRDPFSPLVGGASYAGGNASGGQGMAGGELTNLELKGILKDRKGKVALIAASDGEPFVLRSGRIYDRKNRIVSGVSGIIKENSVILISQNRTVTELSLRTKDEGGSAAKTQ